MVGISDRIRTADANDSKVQFRTLPRGLRIAGSSLGRGRRGRPPVFSGSVSGAIAVVLKNAIRHSGGLKEGANP